MAPGKVRVSKLSNNFQVSRKGNSGIKKTKKGSLSKKKLKEKTLQQIEEVDKNFTAFHNTLVEDESQFVNSKCFIGADKQGNAKVMDKKPISSNTDVTHEELSKTLENIANL